ncbi:MAG: glycoside hydrolase family 127 protein [Kiritimatiellae bacterium]|nr:glycoside hydrolase family 127 protein [Kiritimatiellia bacterium]
MRQMGVLSAVTLGVLSCVGAVKVEGRLGVKAETLFARRLTSEKARKDIFGEAERAFETHFDDVHEQPSWTKKRTGYWQGEYWGKTMLSYCAYARYSGRQDMKDFILAKALKLIRTHQRADGFLGTYADADFVKGGWNIWGRKYTMWALLEAYDLTGERELLTAASKMADHLMAQLARLQLNLADTGGFAGLPSMSILKPMVLLYARTGEKRYLDFARGIVADNDRPDGRVPNLIANAFGDKPVHEWYPKPDEWAKAYELMSVVEGFIAYAKTTGEKRPLEAAQRIWEKLYAHERNVLGGVGYHDHFIGARAYANAITECCDVIHWMRLCRHLHEATGEGKYLDAWEAAFVNAFQAGIYREGEWGAHDVRSHGRRHLTGMYEVDMTYHFCCIDNAVRGFGDWSDCQVREAQGGLLVVNFYTDCTFACGDVQGAIRGNYPVGDTVTLSVTSPRPRRLSLHVPGWCRGGMRLNGAPVGDVARFELDVAAGETTLTLTFAAAPRIEPLVLEPRTAQEVTWPEMHTFEMARRGGGAYFHNPEMKGLSRTTPGVRILRGPLVLAKAEIMGDHNATVFTDIPGLAAQASIVGFEPLTGHDVWGAWKLTVDVGGAQTSVPVCDFASAADWDDPRNAFSIWF